MRWNKSNHAAADTDFSFLQIFDQSNCIKYFINRTNYSDAFLNEILNYAASYKHKKDNASDLDNSADYRVHHAVIIYYGTCDVYAIVFLFDNCIGDDNYIKDQLDISEIYFLNEIGNVNYVKRYAFDYFFVFFIIHYYDTFISDHVYNVISNYIVLMLYVTSKSFLNNLDYISSISNFNTLDYDNDSIVTTDVDCFNYGGYYYSITSNLDNFDYVNCFYFDIFLFLDYLVDHDVD